MTYYLKQITHFVLLKTKSKASASSIIESISSFKVKPYAGPYDPVAHLPEKGLILEATEEEEKEIYC